MSADEKPQSYACPMCDSDIPVEPDIKIGDVYYCSYCKMGLRVEQGKGERLTLEAEEEEG